MKCARKERMERKGTNLKSEHGMPVVSLGGGASGGASIEQFDIDGIKIKAFYDAAHRLLFVLDVTQDEILPNILLVIRGKDDRKWDDILANDFGVNPEAIRPREDNKYQKLDIDYDALDDYNKAIVSGAAEELRRARKIISENQREIRLAEAEREITLARATAGEASKTISDLDDFIELQKDKLKAAKKNVGKEPPKDSAAKILRYEARLERAGAKKARAQRRLRRAEKRIDSAMKLFNNYQNNLLPKGREMNDDNDVKPLFTENPNIIDTENAFKPVSFDGVPEPQPRPRPEPEPAASRQAFVPESAPIVRPEIRRPVAPLSGADIKIQSTGHERQGGAYYFMLMLLIGLSIFTLYLYQKKMNSENLPHIAAVVPEKEPVSMEEPEPAPESAPKPEPLAKPEPVAELAPEPAVEPIPETLPESVPPAVENPFVETEPESPAEPEVAEPEIEAPEPRLEPIAEESEMIEEAEQAEEFATPLADANTEKAVLEYESSGEMFEPEPEPVAEDEAFGVGVEE
ncbi:MAG: hypothetical protein LBT45_02965 [Rickettsiales bacterium]|nr:hypothetical protein [Rickettsiales bacterium]